MKEHELVRTPCPADEPGAPERPCALIPRKTLFGNPERTAVTISHDGTRIAYLAPLDGVLNVWVAPLEAIEVVAGADQIPGLASDR